MRQVHGRTLHSDLLNIKMLMWPLAQKVLDCAGPGARSVCFPLSLTLFQNIRYSHIIFAIKRIFSVVLLSWISLPNFIEYFSAIWKHCVVSTESCQGTQITSWTKFMHCMTFNMNVLVISSGPKEWSALSGGRHQGWLRRVVLDMQVYQSHQCSYLDHVFLDGYEQSGAGEILLNSLKNWAR